MNNSKWLISKRLCELYDRVQIQRNYALTSPLLQQFVLSDKLVFMLDLGEG